MARLRIAFGRIAQETNSHSPVLTELADFERVHLLLRLSGRLRNKHGD